MFVRLIIAAIVLIILFSFWGKLQKKQSKKSNTKKSSNNHKNLTIKIIIGIAVAAVIIAAITGKVPIIGGVLAALVPLGRLFMTHGLQLSRLWFSRTGGNATFNTPYLKVTVNVSAASYSGTILQGPYEGSSIENLSAEQLQELQTHYQNKHKKSYYLIKAIRQSRGFASSGNQQSSNQSAGPPSTNTSYQDALDILGLKGQPNRKEIMAAHRQLINKLHPDRGGSDFLASQVNQARDTLLKNIDA